MRPLILVSCLIFLVSSQVANSTLPNGLGGSTAGLFRSANLAFKGVAPSIPLTMQEAHEEGWMRMNETCDPMRGYRYSSPNPLNMKGPTISTPLTIYYNEAGQISGCAADAYKYVSQNLVDQGFWIPSGFKQWSISVSFRSPENMCNGVMEDFALGDRLVINQGDLDWSLPTNVPDATDGEWTMGSCIDTMGQHWMYDLEAHPGQTWDENNLLPIVPIFFPPDETGVISAFFFSTPEPQPGTYPHLYPPGDWDAPALPPSINCLNYCDSECKWPNVTRWSTMHMYVSTQYHDLTCPFECNPPR